jgi:hypothetical protein
MQAAAASAVAETFQLSVLVSCQLCMFVNDVMQLLTSRAGFCC